jgi:class 3 adenylate cyclase
MSTQTLSILLVDLVGTTRKVTNTDTLKAAQYIEDAMRPIREAITEHEGTFVKFTGDGCLATFTSARQALICADAIRDHFIRQKYTPGGLPVDGVRIVVNTSDVVCEDDGDIVGDGIIVCARLEKSVPANQVWVTAATREVAGVSDFVFQPIGEIQLRGRTVPINVYSLENTELSYVENGVSLLVTDLHRYKHIGENFSPSALNDYLMRWADLHRRAIVGLRGQVRQFVADLALLTFNTPEDAYQAANKLRLLTKTHNLNLNDEMHGYHFKAAIGTGDLILSPTGVVGRLVNTTFDLLNNTPRNGLRIDAESYRNLRTVQDAFEPVDAENEQEVYQFKSSKH